MVSKNQQKQIQQLAKKKFREQSQTFVVEGEKSVKEFYAAGWAAKALYSTTEIEGLPTTVITTAEMKKITHLHSPSPALGVFAMPQNLTLPQQQTAVVLDGVSDPGNLGTILRLADWFGISYVVCSSTSVSCYNPKAVQASMGSLARVQCLYTSLPEFLAQQQLPIYAAVLGGHSVYEETLASPAIFLMGSEAHGISAEALSYAQHQIRIPSAASGQAESLNVATATAILLSEYHRRQHPTQK